MALIEIKTGNITQETTDAIVNAANSTLLGGGGVDGAIHRAAGPKLLAECATLGGCPTGQAKLTQGYNLAAKFVIHTVGPVWQGGDHDEDKLLTACYLNSLESAKKNNIRTIAFPAISTGAYRFPLERAARIAIDTVKNFLAQNQEIEKVVFVCYNAQAYKIYKEIDE